MRRASLVTLAALCGLAPAVLSTPALAQRAGQPVARTLRTPEVEYAEPFTAISGVRELSDGRVIVADRVEKTLQLLDLASGTATPIGREGGGPNEYQMPGQLFALPGDSTALFDFGNMRYLLIAPNGTVAGTFTTVDPGEGDIRLMLAPRAADAQGNFYFFDRGMNRGPGGGIAMASPDSGTVLRFDRRTRTTTPVARVALPKMEVSSSGGPGGAQRFTMRMSSPYAAQDDWVAGLDGRVAVVRHDPYRVEWVAPNGQRVVGPVLPYERLRVTDADKEEYRTRSRGASVQAMSVRIGGGGASGSNAPPPSTANMRLPEPTDWPEFKPPFTGNAAVVAPDGALWVLRTRPAGDRAPRYDVFDSFGKLTGTMVLPADTRLIGFGRNSAYLVRTDEDDLQYLQKYKLW
jgi:hypothetical protein